MMKKYTSRAQNHTERKPHVRDGYSPAAADTHRTTQGFTDARARTRAPFKLDGLPYKLIPYIY